LEYKKLKQRKKKLASCRQTRSFSKFGEAVSEGTTLGLAPEVIATVYTTSTAL